MTTHAAFRHGLLVHDTDEELIEATRAFVARGLDSGADVLVHGSAERLVLMRQVLGSSPRLSYGLDGDLYHQPTRTLFDYQRALAERSEPTELWVTGTVPPGHDDPTQAAWHRYESAVDAALGADPFVALCTYDRRIRPAWVIEAALATHRTVNVDLADRDNPAYVEPAVFLAAPLAARPAVPLDPPTAATVIREPWQLSGARDLVGAVANRLTAVSRRTVEDFRVAVNEVTSNGLLHGRPPVRVTLWADTADLTCLVEDAGAGDLDPMTGYRRPEGGRSMGLWAARQLVDELVIDDAPAGGCRVLLTVRDRPR